MSTAAQMARSIPLLLCLSLAGCASDMHDLFAPEWDRVIEEKGSLGDLPQSLIPTAEPGYDAPLDDFDLDAPINLSVEQAVVRTLRANRDLRVAQLTPVIVGAFEQIELGRFDPELFADASFLREEAVETARSTGESFSVKADDALIAAGVRQELPTGTNIELGVFQGRSISNRAPEQQDARLGLSITQALLRGGGPVVNLAAVRLAELDTRASLFEFRGYIEALIAETETAYWRYLLALRKIDIFEQGLDVARQQNDQVLQRIEVGVLPQTEAAAARSEVALREQFLIDARSELRAAKLQLLRLMNIPISRAAELQILPESSPLPPAPDDIGDAETRTRIARRLRPDLAEANLRLEQNRLETIRTRNGLLPRLDIFIALGKTGYATAFSDSFREITDRTYDFEVGFSLSQELGQNAARGAHRAAIASREQAAASIRNLEQLVELDIANAINDALRARDQIDASATTRQLQVETLRAETQRFEVGASTAILVAQAQRDLLAAEIAEVEAVANYRIALIALYLAEGSLVQRRGIVLTPDLSSVPATTP